MPIGLVGIALFVAGYAASREFQGWQADWFGPVLYAVLAAIVGVIRHRRTGIGAGTLWALAYGGSLVLSLVVFNVAAVAIHPTPSRDPGLSNAWLGIVAAGWVLLVIAASLCGGRQKSL